MTRQSELAPIVATADCVPVLLASAQGVAAIHAGWRGVVAGVVGAAVDRLTKGRAGRDLVAWIGPAIGACCYEVGDEVAAAVAAASAPEVARRGASGRPHLDLARAVVLQLEAAGVRRLLHLDHCTRCRSEWLWSHRRDGAAAGRNLALVWRCQEGPWDGRGQG